MRLLFVSHSLPPANRPEANLGGMQRVATELHRELSQNPNVTLTSVVLRSSSRWNAIRTVPFLWSAYRCVKRLAKRGDIDAVLFSSMVTGSLTVLLHPTLSKSSVRSFAIAHGDDVISSLPFYQRLLPRVMRSLDAVLPVSRATRKACLARGAGDDKVVVVPNGIDTERFIHNSEPECTADELKELSLDDSKQDTLVLCSAGRHVSRKGFNWFIDNVMPQLPPQVHYWLIGHGSETSRIRQSIDRHRLGDRVRLLGRVSDAAMGQIYQRADLFVMPNIHVEGTMEGFGIVMLEAGLCRLSTIASRLEGIEDVIIEGENGHLVESGNVAAFVDVISKYVQDRDGLADLSGRAEVTARQFGWESIAARQLEVMQKFM